MLFSPPGTSRLVRAQGAFVSDEEVHEMVEFLKRNGPPQYAQAVQQQIDRAAKEDEEGGDDAGDDGDLGDDGELYQHRRMDISLKSFDGISPEERRGLYDRLVLELQRSLDHFDREFHHIVVARVMVTPVPGADDMREHLDANLDIPVALIHLSELMDFPHIPELHEDARQAQCLQLIGAAMREEEAAA